MNATTVSYNQVLVRTKNNSRDIPHPARRAHGDVRQRGVHFVVDTYLYFCAVIFSTRTD